MSRLAIFAVTLLLAACGADPARPPATPSGTDLAASAAASASAAAASASARQHPSYDPALKTGFMTEADPDPVNSRTYTWQVGGSGTGERLRPGWWRTEGGPCEFVAPDAKGNAYVVGGGGYAPDPQTVELPAGSTFVVTHLALMSGPGCIWSWERALS